MSKKTQYLYEDIRGCINEGLSPKETADLCGCHINTVYLMSKDIRGSKKNNKIDKNDIDLVLKLHNNKFSTNKIVEETGIELKRVKYIIKYYGYKKKGNTTMINKIPHTIEKETKIETPVVVENNTQVKLPDVSKIENDSVFTNFTACFDGKSARYTVRFNKKVRIMLNGVDFEVPISELKDMSREFAEIAKRFDCFA